MVISPWGQKVHNARQDDCHPQCMFPALQGDGFAGRRRLRQLHLPIEVHALRTSQ